MEARRRLDLRRCESCTAVAHSTPRPVKQPLLAETRLALTRGGIERDAPRKRGARGEASEQAWVWNRLWHLGLNVNDASTLKIGVRTVKKEPTRARHSANCRLDSVGGSAISYQGRPSVGPESVEVNGRWYVDEGSTA